MLCNMRSSDNKRRTLPWYLGRIRVLVLEGHKLAEGQGCARTAAGSLSASSRRGRSRTTWKTAFPCVLSPPSSSPALFFPPSLSESEATREFSFPVLPLDSQQGTRFSFQTKPPLPLRPACDEGDKDVPAAPCERSCVCGARCGLKSKTCRLI